MTTYTLDAVLSVDESACPDYVPPGDARVEPSTDEGFFSPLYIALICVGGCCCLVLVLVIVLVVRRSRDDDDDYPSSYRPTFDHAVGTDSMKKK